MKQFFKFMFASMLGMLLTVIISIFLLVLIIGGIVASAGSSPVTFVSDNSVLHIKLDEEIMDRASKNPLENFDFNSFETKKTLGLNEIKSSLEKAKTDDKIKGIFLNLSQLNTGLAVIDEIRAALIDFKESGKFIISYSEGYSQSAYFLSTVADKVYLNPQGDLRFQGMTSQIMFFKDALEKLDIEMQVIRHGKFKSAVEPFLMNEMSPSNKKQMSTLVHSVWGEMTAGISSARGVTVEELNLIADNISIRLPADAVKHKLVDALKYEDEVMQELVQLSGIDKDEPKLIELSKYKSAAGKDNASEDEDGDQVKSSKNEIAIIYAAGEIRGGKSNAEIMGSETIVEAIKKAAKDDDIKAIVLRVNSPGGSALASDVMWRALELAKAKKPVVVSMGNLAASGGYYISCGANKIFAQPNTITGSIGVFGVVPNFKGLINNKLGVYVDGVSTNKHSDMMINTFRPLDDEETTAITEMVEAIYDDFITKVAAGRGISKADVDSIGQGRVWTGMDAKRIGLVDEIGGLQDALKSAATLAGIEAYEIRELPRQKEPFQQIMEDFSMDAKAYILGENLGSTYKYYKSLEEVSSRKGIMTRVPFDIRFY
jgi:protease-4